MKRKKHEHILDLFLYEVEHGLLRETSFNLLLQSRRLLGVNNGITSFLGSDAKVNISLYSGAGTGGARGPLAPPIFCRSVNPTRTGEGRFSPPITTGPPNGFHLPASLYLDQSHPKYFILLWSLQNIPNICQICF